MRISILALLFFSSLTAWSQLSKDQALELLEQNSPETAAAAITASGLGFEPDQAFMRALCAHPEVMRLILAKLTNGQAPTNVVRPISAREVTNDPDALVVQKIYELANNLTVANRLETTPQVIDRRLGFRDFLVRALMEPNHKVTLKDIDKRLGSNDFLEPWVQTLVNESVAAKDTGYPKVTFSANRSANITLSSAERGVIGYLGLYMVKGDPEDPEFSLEDQLIYTHPTFPMTYNPDEEAFEPGKLKKSSITTLSLTKLFKKTETLQLFPGTWGLRFKHTNGFDSLRSDRTVYFEIEAGKNYDMNFSWENSGNGVGFMAMELVEK